MAQKKTKRNNLVIIYYLLATFSALFLSSILPGFKLIYYSPFLVILFFNTTYPKTLWLASLAGLTIDLLSSTTFGINAINYTLTAALLYRFKQFFNDKPINLSIFTLIVSVVYSILQILLLFIFDKGILISWGWIVTDLLFMPLLDALYAFIWFSCPIILYEKTKKITKNNYELFKKRNFFRSNK